MYRFWWECSVIALLSCFFFCIGFCQMHSDFSTVCHSTTSRKSLWLSLVLPVTRSSKRYNRGCPSCRKNTSPSSQTFRVHHVTIFEEPYYRTCKLPVRAELMSLFMLNKKNHLNSSGFTSLLLQSMIAQSHRTSLYQLKIPRNMY
jgi:hypothetical protein